MLLVAKKKKQELMDAVPTPTRKRKGEPTSHSLLSEDKKDGSDDVDLESRPTWSAANRRRVEAQVDSDENTPLSIRLESETPKTGGKFWQDPEETLSAMSSEEDKNNLAGSRRRTGAPKKKKKKGLDRGSDRDEGKTAEGDKPKNTHKGKGATLRPEEKRRRGPPDSKQEKSLEALKYGHMAASAAGALALDWLTEVEEIRKKTTNMQGRLSGQMKRNVLKLKEVVLSLVGKAEAAGDPLFLKMRNSELTQQLAETKSKWERSKKDLDEANKRLKVLSSKTNQRGERRMA